MIHLVNHHNRDFYQPQLASMHRTRKAVFVDELKWQLNVYDGQEIDEYDDDRAGYVLGFSTEGEVVMGLRYRPADDHSMLGDHFADWLPDDIRPLNDGKTWEVSRGFCIERGVRRHNLRRKAACMVAPLEIALANGIDRCVGLTDISMLNFCYGVGWQLQILGEPTAYAEGIGVAYEVTVSEESVDNMRRLWGLPKPAWIMIDHLESNMDVHDMARQQLTQRPELVSLQAQPEPSPSELPAIPSNDGGTGYYSNHAIAVR